MVVDGSKVETMTEQPTTINTISSDDAATLAADYLKNMGNGKKNLLCGDFPEAVACFQLACSQQSERFGETSHECAESFHFYGKALLELARMENGVLGNALKGVPETEDESESEVEEPQFEKPNIPAEERHEIRKEVEDAMKETESESEDNQATDDESKAAKKTDKTPEENEVTKSEEKSDKNESEATDEKTDDEKKEVEKKESEEKDVEMKEDEKKEDEKKEEEKKEDEKKEEEKKEDEKENKTEEDVSMETEITVESKNGTSVGKSDAAGSSSSNGDTADTDDKTAEAAKGDETNDNDKDRKSTRLTPVTQ